jgi:hypothetical protein
MIELGGYLYPHWNAAELAQDMFTYQSGVI